ncbi:Allophanate hydrolase [Saliniradius amylolyticus]|uniref:Allophanate hydrolase n=1 Tax=Saliniradius amylolyticus TaxID=2183582 RepID=A0A2S2E619_9ALTE|nr:biotin-dependent carboxyltransferase family protein [Saliniradius amylolyticus]AWL13115.1 Allophanate hydrolase [Saliniradius amylolyticus]
MNTLQIHTPGIMAFVTDGGRFAQAHIGLSAGGPADRPAFDMANALLGNDANATAIEVTMGGLEFTIDADTIICVTGAPMPLTINDEPAPLWQTLQLKQGDRVALDYCQSGVRSYVAIKGGFDVTEQFGSTATVIREGIGGLNGGPLQPGDTLSFPATATTDTPLRRLPECWRPEYPDELTLRIVPSYQVDYFSPVNRQIFYTSSYKVSDQADRMGYRLSGPAIPCDLTEMYSEGIAPGAVQVPGDGQPIVLLCDRQTIGGYPKIGSVLSLDCARLAQCRPGARVRFEAISVNEAQSLLHLQKVKLANILNKLEPVDE